MVEYGVCLNAARGAVATAHVAAVTGAGVMALAALLVWRRVPVGGHEKLVLTSHLAHDM